MRLLVAAVALLSISCDPASKEKDEPAGAEQKPELADLAMLCDEAKAANGSGDAERTAFASAVEKKAKSTPMKNVLGAVATVPDAHKLYYFKAGAKEMGAPDWDCPELATVYGEQKDEPYSQEHSDEAGGSGSPAPESENGASGGAAVEAAPPGELNATSMRDAIQRHIKAVRKCYETELAKQPALAGQVDVTIEIGQDGKVLSAKASGLHPTVDACIGKVIEVVRFPEHSDAKPVTVVYPFTFEGKAG